MKTSFINRTLFGIIFVLACLQLSARTFYNGTLTGKLLDGETNEPIPYATVALLNADDNAYIRDVKTDANGSFKVEKVPFGKYKMSTTVLGYQQMQPKVVFNAVQTRVAVGQVALQPVFRTMVARTAAKQNVAGKSCTKPGMACNTAVRPAAKQRS
ncbi:MULTISPECIES: carboxypeptidase regulatory-like domain-containing protein [Hymenobacter]|uniref:Carboxypeptidase-like regulatory domain-containing protein n=1 Tax=Hymenobacter jejuensis TaxID=2502781 RepID=A0A5B8A6L1_9BACT|nr:MULTISPECIES: carboxypeptidase regulatory-like domain-containing protein [Hymenobacter]MBC6991969.1 carboxypeptidase regulatory-like domain-containing protein [Hymenobacter sp. BT491]QDA62336.1 carboxypeptidase-like regulatory domain-containing protein [Hymenobacter jejuensis]